MTVDQIYGPQKAALIERARLKADRYLDQFGLHIEQLFWASNINLPESIQRQINARVANEQQAIAEQAKVATAIAQANARREKARGEADALALTAAAARANPEGVEMRIIDRWNGSVPQVVGNMGSVPFIGPQLSKAK
jgi:regulator of protease activity HflC (stomatin/prohibitin superfamily)